MNQEFDVLGLRDVIGHRKNERREREEKKERKGKGKKK